MNIFKGVISAAILTVTIAPAAADGVGNQHISVSDLTATEQEKWVRGCRSLGGVIIDTVRVANETYWRILAKDEGGGILPGRMREYLLGSPYLYADYGKQPECIFLVGPRSAFQDQRFGYDFDVVVRTAQTDFIVRGREVMQYERQNNAFANHEVIVIPWYDQEAEAVKYEVHVVQQD